MPNLTTTIRATTRIFRRTRMARRRTGKTRRPAKPKAAAPELVVVEEPMLEFRHGQKLGYPRDGLYLYGPVDERADLKTVRYGVIGTPQGIERFRSWSKT